MKLGFEIAPDLVAAMEREIKAGESAVTCVLQAAGQELKADWRSQITRAGLGTRLARTICSRSYPKRGESLEAAALVWTKAPQIIDAHDSGPHSHSESVWGLCLRGGYFFLRRLLWANRYDVLPVSMILQ